MGERIKQLREDAGLSQSELARRVKIRQPSLSNIESGATKELAASTLMGLCRELKTTPNYLRFGRSKAPDLPVRQVPRDPFTFGEWLASQPLEFQERVWDIAAVLARTGVPDDVVESKMPATKALRESHGTPPPSSAPARMVRDKRATPEKPEANGGKKHRPPRDER